jgi:hypothetical protein
LERTTRQTDEVGTEGCYGRVRAGTEGDGEKMNNPYNSDQVLSFLREEYDIVTAFGMLSIPQNAHIGIKVWGMIDFLKMKWFFCDKRGNIVNTITRISEGRSN